MFKPLKDKAVWCTAIVEGSLAGLLCGLVAVGMSTLTGSSASAARPAGGVDPGMIGVSITGLIGSLGAAGAAVAITYYFLGFLRAEGDKQDRLRGELWDDHAAALRGFQDQVTRLNKIQDSLLRDVILALRAVADRRPEEKVLEEKPPEKVMSSVPEFACPLAKDPTIRRFRYRMKSPIGIIHPSSPWYWGWYNPADDMWQGVSGSHGLGRPKPALMQIEWVDDPDSPLPKGE